MSTIHYGVSDLANVILCATEGSRECDARLSLQRTMARVLAQYSTANTLAFVERYGHKPSALDAEPASAEEILEWALEPGPAGDREQCETFLALALYNLDAHVSAPMVDAIRTIAGICGVPFHFNPEF